MTKLKEVAKWSSIDPEFPKMHLPAVTALAKSPKAMGQHNPAIVRKLEDACGRLLEKLLKAMMEHTATTAQKLQPLEPCVRMGNALMALATSTGSMARCGAQAIPPSEPALARACGHGGGY
ncbi:MAG: hypothetical protein AAF991_08525 [Pseudomonadota bacterium]